MALVTASDTAVFTSASASIVGSSGSMKPLTASRAKASFSGSAVKSSRISLIQFTFIPPHALRSTSE